MCDDGRMQRDAGRRGSRSTFHGGPSRQLDGEGGEPEEDNVVGSACA
jgi:hypothetical protein